jgi:hypothetical protein
VFSRPTPDFNNKTSSQYPGVQKIVQKEGKTGRQTMRLVDTFTGREYLVDSGAELCVFPASWEDKKKTQNKDYLIAANGSKIQSYGSRSIALKFGKSTFAQEFTVADVTQPILGANFFAKNHLVIDLAKSRILQAQDWIQLPAAQTVATVTAEELGLHAIRRNVYEELLAKYPELLAHKILPTEDIKHSSEHVIETEGAPLHARARRLDGA